MDWTVWYLAAISCNASRKPGNRSSVCNEQFLMLPGKNKSSDACCRCQCQTSCQIRWLHNSGYACVFILNVKACRKLGQYVHHAHLASKFAFLHSPLLQTTPQHMLLAAARHRFGFEASLAACDPSRWALHVRSTSCWSQLLCPWQVNPMTAKGLVETSKPPEGEYMIQTAAGSTLGRMITSIAKHLGIKIIDVVRRTAQKEELEKLG